MGISKRQEERSTLEKDWALIMAGNWHGLGGPADFLIPDDTRELVYSGLATAGTTALAYVVNHREVTRALAREAPMVARVYAANPKAIYPRAALRVAAQRTVVRGTVWRGVAMVLAPVPIVGWTLAALAIAYSLPPSGNPLGQTMPGDVRYTHLNG